MIERPVAYKLPITRNLRNVVVGGRSELPRLRLIYESPVWKPLPGSAGAWSDVLTRLPCSANRAVRTARWDSQAKVGGSSNDWNSDVGGSDDGSGKCV